MLVKAILPPFFYKSSFEPQTDRLGTGTDEPISSGCEPFGLDSPNKLDRASAQDLRELVDEVSEAS